jgi:hypothetical protein
MRWIGLVLLLSTTPVLAQYPGVAPSVPSPFTPPPQLGGAPAPPVALPVPAVPRSSPPSLVTRPNARPVEVPGGPGYFGDKVERCMEAGAGAGVGPNEMGAFTRRCVQ